MREIKWSVCVLVLLIGAVRTAPVMAHGEILLCEEFSSDPDGLTFEPDTRNPVGEADFGGVPPFAWNDIRTGWVGVIEENLVLGDAGYPPADPGAVTPEYGVVQPESGNGPYWSAAQADFTQDRPCPILCFNVDNYADPLILPNVNGIPDWWWTNAVNDHGGNYLTETGITGTANPGATWTYSTTSGVPIATVPIGDWYELEVCYITSDPSLAAVHNVWDSTHSVLLGSVTVSPLFLSPMSSDLAGPRYSWFTNFESNVDVLFVDEFCVECVPEPSSLLLAGLGVVGLVTVARKRRTA